MQCALLAMTEHHQKSRTLFKATSQLSEEEFPDSGEMSTWGDVRTTPPTRSPTRVVPMAPQTGLLPK